MSIQRTYAMLKPGILQRRVAGEIINRLEKKGLNLVGIKILQITPEMAKKHYQEHSEKSFFNDLVSYITSAPVVAMVWEGDNAVSLVRKLCGSTSVDESQPGTIRGDYSAHTPINVIHSSDSQESADREIGIFFKPEEIVSWTDNNQCWF